MNKSNYKQVIKLFVFFMLFVSSNLFAKAPEINILVAQYEKSLEFMMPEGGTWSINKKDFGDILPGVTYKIEGKLMTPAQRKFHLMVATVDITDDGRLMDISEKYNKMGFKIHTISVGESPKAVGMPDNRVIHIGIDCFDDKEKAENKKSELAAKNVKTWIYIENIINSTGVLNLSSKDQNFASAFRGTGYTLKSKKGTILKNVEHSKGYSWQGKENRTYLGELKINFGFEDCIDCVEKTDLESLLVGVVPSEISSKAPKAAMQAQAVAARGEILSKKGLRHVNSGYSFCAEQHCQVYKGYQKISSTISEKIKDTEGEILLMAAANRILDAVYSANCGGHTSANQNIWIGFPNPHLQGVSDERPFKKRDLTNENELKKYITKPPISWCGSKGYEGASKYRWEKILSTDDWKKVETNANIGNIKSVEIRKRDVSGRIFEMKLTGSNGSRTYINELEIRQLFGGLRSSCFIADFKKNKEGFIVSAVIKGAGFGHGVGMCQTGAQAMAGFGIPYNDILKHYFPGARLIKLY